MPIILLFVAVGLLVKFHTHAVTASGTYSTIYMPPIPAGGYSSIQHSLTMYNVTPNASYFWSHQVWFLSGDGGYFGLQSGSNASQSKVALFSLWNTTTATGTNCGPFSNEGSGMHCSIAYSWVMGRMYNLKLAKTTTDSNGVWWQATVQDSITGVTSIIGNIEVASNWQGISDTSVVWTEYFGTQAATCATQPYSLVLFSNQRVNGTITQKGPPSNSYGNGVCTNSRIIPTGSNDEVQEMGDQPLPGDLNGDQADNISDLSIIASHFGTTGALPYTGDINYDGAVNISDLSILASHFGQHL